MGMEDEGCHGDAWLDRGGGGGRHGQGAAGMGWWGQGWRGWWSLPVPRPRVVQGCLCWAVTGAWP